MNFSFPAFLIGIILSQKISIGGEIFIGELVALMYILINLNRLYLPKLMKQMLCLAFIWIFAQIISDIFNETPLLKTIKGVGTPFFLMSSTLALATYFKDKQALVPSFFLGTTIGLWIYFLMGSPYYDLNPWKWGLGRAIGVSLLIYFSYWFKGKNKSLLIYSVLFLIVSISQSSRSLGGMLFISVIAYFILNKINMNKRWALLRRKKTTTFNIIVLLLVFVIGMNFILSAIFTSELFLKNLPEEDALKYSTQASSDLGFLLGARSEIVISLQAFMDSPLIGHGSWPENYEYVYQYIHLVDLMGGSTLDYKTAISLVKSGLIPSHSFIMGAMVWGGLFSGLFWLFMLYKIIDNLVKNSDRLILVQVYLSITTLWNILFSPFGASARWSTALAIWIIFYTFNTTKNIKKKRRRVF